MKIFAVAGFKNSGKTHLVVELVERFTARGLRVATVKHAHHDFDIDQPGKDSWRHRRAGAAEVIVVSAQRWAHVRELGNAPEPSLQALVSRLGEVDLVLAEGFKHAPVPKLQLIRDAGDPLLADDDPTVVAVVSDLTLTGLAVPRIARNDLDAIMQLVLAHAAPPD